MDLQTLKWDSSICSDLGISILPEICPSSDFFGTINQGVLKGVPITGILGDQQSALFGHKCFNNGDMKITYGTGCFLLQNTDTNIIHNKKGLLTTVAYQLAGSNSAIYADSTIQWLQNNLGIIQSTSETDSLALSVEDTGGVFFVPAFSGLFAPHWNSKARGIIVGLTGYSKKEHIVRAALESTAFMVKDIVEALRVLYPYPTHVNLHVHSP